MISSRSNKDKELIESTIEGDKQAFCLLVEAHKDRALSLAISIVKDKALAEDILQEVFIRVYHKLSGFRFQSSFATWLYRIVVRSCYNELKKKRYTLGRFSICTNLRWERDSRFTI